MDKFPPRSVERAFIEYWSDLQFQAWAGVVSYFDPTFREFVGTADIIAGKKLNASSYPELKPEEVEVRDGPESTTTVYYSLRFLDGTKELDSTTWRKVDGNWQIIYESRLDAELSQHAANEAEIGLNGVLPTDPNQTLSPAATRADNAAGQLQARFLQQELSLNGP